MLHSYISIYKYVSLVFFFSAERDENKKQRMGEKKKIMIKDTNKAIGKKEVGTTTSIPPFFIGIGSGCLCVVYMFFSFFQVIN